MIESLENLFLLFTQHGGVRFFAKRLAPNDNSKNQVYLGGDFSALNIFPHGEVTTDQSSLASSKRDRAKAPLRFYWVEEHGKFEAPNAQLILYPKYPEVRMSGFLKGCRNAPSNVMNSRDEGRVLFFAVTDAGAILAYAVTPEHPLSQEVEGMQDCQNIGVFIKLHANKDDRRSDVISKLTEIYHKHWIDSKKIGADGLPHPYKARNGGGYTLEAELGISPNGYSEPDYLGWEVKQYGVSDFKGYSPKSKITLMTPEPTDGFYKTSGVYDFMKTYGYKDKSGRADRINFGGVYTQGKKHHKDTGLRIELGGYDISTGKITDVNSGIVLLDQNENVAACWNYSGMLSHWNRKHSLAVYVPSLFRSPPPQYRYGPKIRMCEKTDFLLFLKSFANGRVSYEPGIKMEKSSSQSPIIKRRSQFRVTFSEIPSLYGGYEDVQLDLTI